MIEFAAWRELHSNHDRLTAVLNEETLEDLEERIDKSSTARDICMGYQDYLLGKEIIKNMKNSNDDKYILELFSSAIQKCGHFLELDPMSTGLLTMLLLDLIQDGKQSPLNIDLDVCATFLKFPEEALGGAYPNSVYLLTRKAIVNRALEKYDRAKSCIAHALVLEKDNLDLMFHCFVLEKSNSMLLEFTEAVAADNVLRPRGKLDIICLD